MLYSAFDALSDWVLPLRRLAYKARHSEALPQCYAPQMILWMVVQASPQRYTAAPESAHTAALKGGKTIAAAAVEDLAAECRQQLLLSASAAALQLWLLQPLPQLRPRLPRPIPLQKI